jgi:hypothetical protein
VTQAIDHLAIAAGLSAELAISPGSTVPVPVIDGVLLSRMQIGTWHTRAGGFDILRGIPKTATSEARFEELAARARTAQLSGHTILVADLEDVVRSKRIADRPKTTKRYPSWTSFVKPLPPPDCATPRSRCNRRSSHASRPLPAPSPTDPGQESSDHAARNWTAEHSSQRRSPTRGWHAPVLA